MKAALALVFLFASLPALGQQAHPVPRPDGDRRQERGEVALKPPPPSAADRTPRTVAIPGRPAPNRGSKDAGGLAGLRALSFDKDEAQVRVAGAAVRLRAGSSIEGYTVKSVEPGRIVLVRAEGIAVVTFDATGRGRVVLYRASGDTAEVP